jgi:hypothetical protein
LSLGVGINFAIFNNLASPLVESIRSGCQALEDKSEDGELKRQKYFFF